MPLHIGKGFRYNALSLTLESQPHIFCKGVCEEWLLDLIEVSGWVRNDKFTPSFLSLEIFKCVLLHFIEEICILTSFYMSHCYVQISVKLSQNKQNYPQLLKLEELIQNLL